MIEILLVFSINGSLEDISDRIFTSKTECAEFVNTLAQMEVVDEVGKFKFIANDGAMFKGQCVEMKEWFLKKGKLGI